MWLAGVGDLASPPRAAAAAGLDGVTNAYTALDGSLAGRETVVVVGGRRIAGFVWLAVSVIVILYQ